MSAINVAYVVTRDTPRRLAPALVQSGFGLRPLMEGDDLRKVDTVYFKNAAAKYVPCKVRYVEGARPPLHTVKTAESTIEKAEELLSRASEYAWSDYEPSPERELGPLGGKKKDEGDDVRRWTMTSVRGKYKGTAGGLSTQQRSQELRVRVQGEGGHTSVRTTR